jgi:hypothetical protein
MVIIDTINAMTLHVYNDILFELVSLDEVALLSFCKINCFPGTNQYSTHVQNKHVYFFTKIKLYQTN